MRKIKKLISGQILVHFGPNLVPKIFLWVLCHLMLCIAASYHHMQLQGTLMSQTWEKGKKPSFWLDLGRHFFFKNLTLSVTRYHGQLICTISEKSNDPILRKLDGWTQEQTDPWEQFHKMLYDWRGASKRRLVQNLSYFTAVIHPKLKESCGTVKWHSKS